MARGFHDIHKVISPHFVLGPGHVSFFYDKGHFLSKRFQKLRTELIKRGYNINLDSVFDEYEIFQEFPELDRDYFPTDLDIQKSRDRIQSKLDMRPGWYRKTVS